MKEARLSVLPDERRLIIGKDFTGVFEKGHVYYLAKIDGEIIVKDLGESDLVHTHVRWWDVNRIIEDGEGAHILTHDEVERMHE